jgi:hypothetical protein
VAEAEQPEDHERGSLWLTLREPFVGLFELIGSVLVLTGQTLVWLIRPPYRFGQLLLAME